MLPMLEPGNGSRFDDCATHDACLSRFVKRYPSASSARCPLGCSSYAPVPSHVRLAVAQTYGALPAPNRT